MNIKTNQTSKGKMLSGFVNKYINERGAFNTGVCQYTFGLDPETATEGESPTVAPESTKMNGTTIKFPTSARRSTAAND